MKTRKQILLTQKNCEFLRKKAEESGLAESELLRRILDQQEALEGSHQTDHLPKNQTTK
jgi:hypothetical protein